MSTRKISECINIRINVGNYQHIELVKYAEEQIDYANEAERIQKEDQLRDDLVASMTRSMKAIPEKLGKGVANAIEVEQSIKKAVPEWMAQGGVPNIANTAKKIEVRVSAEQKDKKDKETEANKALDVEPTVREKLTALVQEVKAKGKDDDVSEDPLFEEDFASGKSKDLAAEREEVLVQTAKVEVKTETKVKSNPVFDDDDLFGPEGK